jgi:hypothetical protein
MHAGRGAAASCAECVQVVSGNAECRNAELVKAQQMILPSLDALTEATDVPFRISDDHDCLRQAASARSHVASARHADFGKSSIVQVPQRTVS